MTEEQYSKIIDSLARLETHVGSLVGNGTPGRVGRLELDVDELKKDRWKLGGAISGISIAGSSIIHFLFKH
jgi:hypothetical protein